MAQSDMGKQVFYRILLVIALTIILGVGAGVLQDFAQLGKIFVMLAIPFVGFLFIRGLTLWQRILVALIAGLIVGMVVGGFATSIKPVGSLFINLIKMLIVPLVFSTLLVGAASTGDLQKLGRIGGKNCRAVSDHNSRWRLRSGCCWAQFFSQGPESNYKLI